MKPTQLIATGGLGLTLLLGACNNAQNEQSASTETTQATLAGQSAVQDDVSEKDVVKTAVASPDHSTLVKAVQAADLVNVLSNAGPFTVFAPTNAAFEKLPAGTVEELLKPEKKADLQDILQYHVYVGALKAEDLTDGRTLNEVNGGNITISNKDGKIVINDAATVVASVKASNGYIHVIDGVLVPKK
ncbi:MAG: fasciclin domain-containing protein [Cytophagales bacterium]|jgi:uncharacterized surface protein with fasciclin (FAS1) repeats|nr:fasciclin domain-containing protein [Cytophagales bacterium]